MARGGDPEIESYMTARMKVPALEQAMAALKFWRRRVKRIVSEVYGQLDEKSMVAIYSDTGQRLGSGVASAPVQIRYRRPLSSSPQIETPPAPSRSDSKRESDLRTEILAALKRFQAVLQERMASEPNLDWARVSPRLVGNTHDSSAHTQENYLTRMHVLMTQTSLQLRGGRLNGVMTMIFDLVKLGMDAALSRELQTGTKVRAGGRRGHEARYGTEEKKEAQRENYRWAFNELRARGIARMAAYKGVAERFGVAPITVRRAVRNRTD